MDYKTDYDIEAKAAVEKSHVSYDGSDNYVDDGAIHAETLIVGDSWYAKTQRFATKFGVEARGIERVPEDERTDSSMSKIGTMVGIPKKKTFKQELKTDDPHSGFLQTWSSLLSPLELCLTRSSTWASLTLSSPLSSSTSLVYYQSASFQLSVQSSVYAKWSCQDSGSAGTVSKSVCCLVRYRTRVIANKFIVAVFNVLACVGWSSVNVIVGAQLLNAVNPDRMPGWAGIIVIAISTLLICLFGYKLVHTYERYSWIPCTIIFLIILGEFAHSGQFSNLPMGVGKAEAGAVLSYSASVFGFATGWTSYAADYTVYQPVGSSRVSIFFWTFAGLIIPLLFTEFLGVAVGTAMAANTDYLDGYNNAGIGGLLAQVLVPPLGRFGQFCLVILALSIIANNCPNIYSVSLSLQLLARWTQRVPRFLWTLLGTVVYCAIAIPGYSHFESILENFMLVIGYWLAIYEGISLSEHFFFKRGFTGYHPEDYMDRSKLPPGIAAIIAFCLGVMGAILGMAQTWFIGPIGKLCGTDYGGDIGFELAFTFAATSYCGMRFLEKKYFQR
jgi:NCS1 nucleoside transporter family